jgi:hypothetical protein
MSVFKRKLRQIYGPFLLVTAGSVAAYSALSWLLLYRTRLLDLAKDLVAFWLPVGLSWIPLLIWIWPRIKVLNLEAARAGMPVMYLIIAAITVIGPTTIGQEYLARAMATLTPLEEVGEISRSPATRYYAVTRPCLRREAYQSHWAAGLTGRHREDLTFTIAVAVPFCDATGTPGGGPAPAWLGIAFTRSMSASSPDDQKEAEARAFTKGSEAEFAKMDLAAFTYLERLEPGWKRMGFEAAIRKSNLAAPDPIVLLPRHGPFEERTGALGAWALCVYLGGAAVWLVMILIPGVHEARLRDLEAGGSGSCARPSPAGARTPRRRGRRTSPRPRR